MISWPQGSSMVTIKTLNKVGWNPSAIFSSKPWRPWLFIIPLFLVCPIFHLRCLISVQNINGVKRNQRCLHAHTQPKNVPMVSVHVRFAGRCDMEPKTAISRNVNMRSLKYRMSRRSRHLASMKWWILTEYPFRWGASCLLTFGKEIRWRLIRLTPCCLHWMPLSGNIPCVVGKTLKN